ncbi:MAG TPA: hypothetical protein VJB14_15285, partial [Planctomycetota bacterium]|nr:hypothetical protein [Planctomycetota bacterium]
KPAPPKVQPPKPVVVAKVEPPKPAVVAKVDPPKPVEPPKPSPVVIAMANAAALIREAAPLYHQVAEGAEPTAELESRLSRARELYVQVKAEAPDPAVLDRRIAVIDELLEALRVPDALERASRLFREARPLYRGAAKGDAGAAEQARKKLREARKIYMGLQAQSPDPKSIAARVGEIDGLLEALGD